jgi:lysozyme
VGDIEVTCNYQDAAGQYAEFEYQGILHQVLHLSVCTPGSYTFGQVFAETGATGRGTGAHADIRVKQDGQRVLPAREVIHAMFAPQDFKIAATDPAPATPGATAQLLSGDVMAQATQLIKEFEGFHPSPYWDYAQWTWGYGTRAPGRHGTISRERAEAELQAYLRNNCVPIIEPLNVSSSQAVALLSFCFNVGPEQFSTSTLVGLIRQGAPADQVAWEFGQWTKAGGKELQGLKNRRAQEKQIFDGNQ